MNMRITIVILLAVVWALMSGCAYQRAIVGERGRQVSDAVLHDGLWTVCDVSTEGAVRRYFGDGDEREAYDGLCIIYLTKE